MPAEFAKHINLVFIDCSNSPRQEKVFLSLTLELEFMSTFSVFERICLKLDEVGVKYELEHHAPVVTSEEAARARGVSLHSGAKALVMQGKKTKKYVLFVMPADRRFDKHKAKQIVGEEVGFASDPVTVTGCVKGSVPPFGSVFGLPTYCDPGLADNELINFNAGTLTDSVRMRYEDYVKIEQPRIVDFVEVSSV